MKLLTNEKTLTQKAIANKTVLWGVVKKTILEKDGTETMILKQSKNPFTMKQIVIKRDEADYNFKSGSMSYLVGFQIPFIILNETEDGKLLASRKQAQDILLSDFMKTNPEENKKLSAKIIHFTNYGAIVSVNGVCGILKNSDYSIDYSEIREYLKLGNHVNVYLKKLESYGKLYFEAVDKVHRKEIPQPDFEIGSVIIGQVKNINRFNNHRYAFVHLGTGLEAIAYIPDDMIVNEGYELAVKVISIEPSEKPYMAPKIKVKIEKVIMEQKRMTYKPLKKVS